MFDATVMAAAASAALPGCLLGLGAGLVPGLHANTLAHALLAYPAVALMPVSVGASAAVGSPEAMAAAAGFLFGMALGHAFTDDIPAVFFGAPDSETALSTLPGHRLLSAGLGEAAVRATARGSLLGVLLSLPLVPVLAWLMGPPNNGYDAIRPVIPWALLSIAAVLIASERGTTGPRRISRGRARLVALGLLLASAFLGELVMFNGSVGAAPPLLALFAGLFGIPTLLLASASPAARAPGVEAREREPLDTRATVKSATLGTGAGAVVGWLPGMGAAQATTLVFVVADFLRLRPSRAVRPSREAASFLVATAAVGTANLMFNLVALSVLQRERSGVMVAVNEVAGPVLSESLHGGARADTLIGMLVGAVAALPLCYLVAVNSGRFVAWGYARTRPEWLTRVCIVGLVVMILVLEGIPGLFVAVVSTCLGLVPPVAGVKRVHLMGCVLLPVSIRIATL